LHYINFAASTPLLDKAFNLPALLQDVYAIVKPEAQTKDLILSCDVPANIPETVRGDRLRTQHILLHIMANAIKFTPSGYVHLQAKLHANHEKQWVIQFIIDDSGIGIPEDKRDVIFEQFHRLTPSHRALYTGKGLGLTIVKQFLDELGGEVQVKGAVGQGTTFELLIPFKKSLST
jgi:signal transduction histidine kinase